MDLLKLAVLGGIGYYVFSRYLVSKTSGSGTAPAGGNVVAAGSTSDRPTVDWDKVREALTDPILSTDSKYQGFAVGEPMYQPKIIQSDADVPWSDRAKFIM